MRLPIAIPLTLAWEGGSARALTNDLGAGGFSSLLASAPPATTLTARLSLGPGLELCVCARPVAVRRRSGNVQVCFAFQDLAEPELAKLQRFLTEMAAQMLPVRPEWAPPQP